MSGDEPMTKSNGKNDQELVAVTFKLLTKVADNILKYIDLRFFQDMRTSWIKYRVLERLAMTGGKAKHSELADWTNTKKHNITTLVDRMKNEQLVTTEWSTTDRRVNYVLITTKGRQLYKRAVPVNQKITEEIMHGIGTGDTQKLDKLLNVIKGNIEKR